MYTSIAILGITYAQPNANDEAAYSQFRTTRTCRLAATIYVYVYELTHALEDKPATIEVYIQPRRQPAGSVYINKMHKTKYPYTELTLWAISGLIFLDPTDWYTIPYIYTSLRAREAMHSI